MYDKKDRTPKNVANIYKDKNRVGVITAQEIQPGDTIFTDQYHTSVEGFVFSQKQHKQHQFKCLGGTLFCNDTRKKIFTYNQVVLGAHETIAFKFNIEQESLAERVHVKCYSSYNGVYISDKFMR